MCSEHALPPVGAWARAGSFVGLVVAAPPGDHVTLFDPAERQSTRVASGSVERLPAGAVTVRLTIDLPLPHGLGEDALRRWGAVLIDPMLRERAREALNEAGLDPGPALPPVHVELVPAADTGHLCVAGHRTPAVDDADVTCGTCGRAAVGQPRPESR